MPPDPTATSLFEAATPEPLAARMRPRTLDEFVGQDHIVGPGRLLRRAIEADQLSSLIFYGPPGTGKTTLARVIAGSTMARFVSLNAVLSGVKEIREAVASAQSSRRAGARTILFVDEVHRFNKAQQDALLPWVENGTVVLIGATTENPFFEVNKALVSRSRIFQLKPLEEADLERVVQQALDDPVRGYGGRDVDLLPDALSHLVNVANGDARALLNALELAVETTPPDGAGRVVITREVAEESIQQRAVLYDKEGDAHFDTISAFIKSVRGSDADAAMYWLAKMVYAGEDARFILRRLLILASEDVGMADPQALVHTAAAAAAFDNVGLPEGRYHLAQATLYLATAPKSNSTMGFFDALEAVRKEREAEVPNHLRDASRDAKGFGHGAGYAYPHAYRDHWVEQQYLPTSLQGKVFYRPSEMGFEGGIRDEVARRREAQLAAMLEVDGAGAGELLTFSPPDAAREKWLERTVTESGLRLAQLRSAVFEAANVQRHHVVLDLKAGSGLLTWEAVRRAPEGQVWALEGDAAAAQALREQARALDELNRPRVVVADAAGLGAAELGDVAFDVVLGRAVLTNAWRGGSDGLAQLFASLRSVTAAGGTVVLAEPHTRMSQRLFELVRLPDGPLSARLEAAEEQIYATDGQDAQRLGPSPEVALRAALDAGFAEGKTRVQRTVATVRLSPATVAAWFEAGADRPSYADHLARTLDEGEIAAVRRTFGSQLASREVEWASAHYLLVLRA